MRKMSHNNESGFIALMSAILIGAVLMTVALGASRAGFYARFDALGSEQKRVSLGLAESCAHVALLALATSTDPIRYFVSNQTVTIGNYDKGKVQNCTITSIMHDGASTTINTRASFQNAFSNISLHAYVYDTTVAPVPHGHDRVEIISWQEVL